MIVQKSVLIVLALMLLAVVAHSQAAAAQGLCNYVIAGSNNTYFGNASCTNAAIVFENNASQNSFYCKDSFIVANVTFGNGTFNNTMYNCVFASAKISSLRRAMNNIISPYGTYNFSFEDNYSNIALGYYFNFIPLDENGNIGTQGFASVMPYSLEQKSFGLAQTQGTTQSELVKAANISNYLLPRFGVYAPGPVTNGKVATFKLETEQVYKNKTISYEPYWFICPFWGWDELTFKTFYIYGNMNFTPTLIYPDMLENIQYPDNTNIFWNYTIIKYDNAPNMTLYFWKGYQVAPDGKVMAILRNATNGNVSYDRGVQSLGVHETIAVLKSPQFMEHDNSTTETYGVGLSFCTDGEPPIMLPGYYSLTYGSLHMLRTFWITNQTCAMPLIIRASNVAINCEGGTINSTEDSISLSSVKNVTIENCNIYGNALNVSHSSGITLQNSTLYANNASNIAINAAYSNIDLAGVKIIGYSKPYSIIGTNMTISSIKVIKITTTTTTAATTVSPGATATPGIIATIEQGFDQKPNVSIAKIVGFVLAAYLIIAALYFAISKALDRAGRPKTKRRKRKR